MDLKKLFISFLFLSLSLFAGDIRIAVAADMAYTIQLLVKEFKTSHPDVDVKVMLGSDSKIKFMIDKGAKYELFISSNIDYPRSLYKEGMAINEPGVYALDEIAVFSTVKRDMNNGLEILKDKDISKIWMFDPQKSYYGKSALEAMKRKDIYEQIKDKLLYFHPASQSMSYRFSKNEVGIIAKSSLYNPHMAKYKKGKNWTEINILLFTPVDQSVVILKSGEKNRDVKDFYDFLFSNSARTILKKSGYTVD